MESFWIDFVESCFESILYKFFYLWNNVSVHVKVKFSAQLILNNFAKVLQTQLIVTFKFSKVIGMLLNRIIGQMYKFICNIIQIEFFTWSAHISIFIKISFHRAPYRRHNAIASKIKFSFVHQQGIVNIFLNYKSPFIFFRGTTCANNRTNLLKRPTNLNSIASVSVFTRFNDPGITGYSVLFASILDFFCFIFMSWGIIFGLFFTVARIYWLLFLASTTEAVPWRSNVFYQIFLAFFSLFNCFFWVYLLLFYSFFKILVIRHKFAKLSIFYTLASMKS